MSQDKRAYSGQRAAKLHGLPLTSGETNAHETVSIRFHTRRTHAAKLAFLDGLNRKDECEAWVQRQRAREAAATYALPPPPRYANRNVQSRIGVARGNHAPFAAPSPESLLSGDTTMEIAVAGSWSNAQGRKHGVHTDRKVSNAMDAEDLAVLMAARPQRLVPRAPNSGATLQTTLDEHAAANAQLRRLARQHVGGMKHHVNLVEPHGAVAAADARADVIDWGARKRDAAATAQAANAAIWNRAWCV